MMCWKAHRRRPIFEELTMKKLLIAVSAVVMAIGATVALAEDINLINAYADNDMQPLTPAQTAQLKAERDAAKAKWAAMTPAERAAAKRAAQSKRVGDLTATERLGLNDDFVALTHAQTAEAKAQRDAAKAKWNALTPAQKSAARKAMQQKRLADLNDMERFGANDDMSRWVTGY
jgi:hypothetical protein